MIPPYAEINKFRHLAGPARTTAIDLDQRTFCAGHVIIFIVAIQRGERTLPSILENLRKDHENLARLLELFERELSRFEQARGCDYERMVDILDYCVKFPDQFHHPLEDMVFASLCRCHQAATQPIGDLRNLHAALAAQTQAVMSLVGQAHHEEIVSRAEMLEAGRTFVQTYRDHMQMEDEHFFPAAEQALTEKDWAEIDATWLGPFDPALTARADAHYRRLCRELLVAEDEFDAS